MIKLTNPNELEVRLSGASNSNVNLKLIAIISLLDCILGIAIYLTFGWVMALVFLFIVGVCALVYLSNAQKSQPKLINQGVLRVTKGNITHEYAGKHISYTGSHCNLSVNDKIILLSMPQQGNEIIQISGFESQKEAQMVQAFLQGDAVKVQRKSIKMQST